MRERLLIALRPLGWALIVGAFLVLAIGENPIDTGLKLGRGAFGSWHALARTFQNAAPLAFTGLAVALAFRAGLLNIGVEGQMVLGALAAGWVGASGSGGLLLAIGAAMVVASAWAAVAGLLRAAFGVHEVLATIMLNFIGLLLAEWIVGLSSVGEPGPIPQTPVVVDAARFPTPFGTFGFGMILALLLALGVYLLFSRTRVGFDIRAVGASPRAAHAGGIGVGSTIIIAMVLSGALAGLAGAQQVLDVHGRYVEGFSPGWGFLGIAVAFLGRHNPIGVIAAALLFGALKSGALAMDALTDVPREVIAMLQVLVLILVATESGSSRAGQEQGVG